MEIDFQKLMSNKSDEGLQEYLNNLSKFTPEAIEAVIVEFQKRGRVFSDEELNTIRQKLQQVSDDAKKEYKERRKANPYYWLGLLGFIPLFGAIVGVVLILTGIFRFKDKILLFIGTACVLFTVGVYSYLFYIARNSEYAATGFATIAQIQVNSLVQEIEFYKLQHGVYPNQLENLKENNKFVPIVDPIILNHTAEGNLNYRYERVGSRYKVYSVGVDLTENTTDDIFPNLANSDTTKIGFIKK